MISYNKRYDWDSVKYHKAFGDRLPKENVRGFYIFFLYFAFSVNCHFFYN